MKKYMIIKSNGFKKVYFIRKNESLVDFSKRCINYFFSELFEDNLDHEDIIEDYEKGMFCVKGNDNLIKTMLKWNNNE